MLLTLSGMPHGEVIPLRGGDRDTGPRHLTNPAVPDQLILSQSLPALGTVLPETLGKSSQHWTRLCPSTVCDGDFPAVAGFCAPAGSQRPAAAATLQRLCHPHRRSSALSCPQEPFPASQELSLQAAGSPASPCAPWTEESPHPLPLTVRTSVSSAYTGRSEMARKSQLWLTHQAELRVS